MNTQLLKLVRNDFLDLVYLVFQFIPVLSFPGLSVYVCREASFSLALPSALEGAPNSAHLECDLADRYILVSQCGRWLFPGLAGTLNSYRL